MTDMLGIASKDKSLLVLFFRKELLPECLPAFHNRFDTNLSSRGDGCTARLGACNQGNFTMRRVAIVAGLAAFTLPAAAADLTLHRVMLSAAGVGYFEFDGKVDGAGTLGLDVPLDQVDDVLNSLAVFDDHGGVGSIELPGRDDTHQAFADVPFAQAMLNSPADLLVSLRGEEVAVSGPVDMTGRIVSAVAEPVIGRPRTNDADHQAASHMRVTLLTADGLRQFIMEDAASVSLTDAGLRARVGAALDAARQQTAASSRHLTLRSTGDGARTVSVGYVAAVPLWKATYRVVLPAAVSDKAGSDKVGADKARVQGWAVLENQSGADWKGVDLTLHAGNPVTFHQAIYASYYADRPEVPVEVLGRILPAPDERAAPSVEVRAQRRLYRENPAGFGSAFAPPPPPPPITYGAANAAAGEDESAQTTAGLAEPSTPSQAAETVIDTSFHTATPLDLARGHSASVPILDQQLPAEQVDWLQAGSNRLVTALRLTNTGATSLPGGALTLYTTDAKTGVAFAGDARLSGLPAGESRLLAFAEDLRTTATRSTSSAPNVLLHVSVADGVLRRSMRLRTVYEVTLIAPARDARRVLVEFPKSAGAAFSVEGGNPPGQEETSTAWRVPVDLKPGEVRHLTAYSDVDRRSEDALLSDNTLQAYLIVQVLTEGQLDPSAEAGFRGLLELRDTEAARQAALHRLAAEQSAVSADEDRLRNNLRVVQGPGDLHTKLLAALDADETRLSALHADIARAQADVDQAHVALADAVRKLNL